MSDHWQYTSARAAARRYVELESQLQGSSQAINPEWIQTKGCSQRRPSSGSDDAVSERHMLEQVFTKAEELRAEMYGVSQAARDRLVWEASRMHDIPLRRIALVPELQISKTRAGDVAGAFDALVLRVLEKENLRYLSCSTDEDRRINNLAPMRVSQAPWSDDG